MRPLAKSDRARQFALRLTGFYSSAHCTLCPVCPATDTNELWSWTFVLLLLWREANRFLVLALAKDFFSPSIGTEYTLAR